MHRWPALLLLLPLLGALDRATAVELTFELPDNAKECFYQEIEKNVTSTLEFQVGFLLRGPIRFGAIGVDYVFIGVNTAACITDC